MSTFLPAVPDRGRPKGKEGIKRIKFKISTYQTWNTKKENMRLTHLTNSEFAELLLHSVDANQNTEKTDERPRKRKRTEPRRQLWSTPVRGFSSPIGLHLSPITESTTNTVKVDITGETSIDDCKRISTKDLHQTSLLRAINPLYGTLDGDPFENSNNDSGSEDERDTSTEDSEEEDDDDDEDDSISDFEEENSYRSEEHELSLSHENDSATLTASCLEYYDSTQEEMLLNQSDLHQPDRLEELRPLSDPLEQPQSIKAQQLELLQQPHQLEPDQPTCNLHQPDRLEELRPLSDPLEQPQPIQARQLELLQQPHQLEPDQPTCNQQFGPKVEAEFYRELSERLKVQFSELSKVNDDLKVYAEQAKSQRVVAEVTQIESLFVGKCNSDNCKEHRKILQSKLQSGVLTISYSCSNGHSGMWTSSSVLTKKRGQTVYTSTILLSASVLVTGNNYDKVTKLFNFLNCSFISKATFNRIQTFYAAPAIKEYWTEMKELVDCTFKDTTLIMSGDGRMDSPGYSAKYCVYTIMDHKLNAILDMEVVDKREAGGTSTLMEKMALKRLLERMLNKFLIGEITTDASSTIQKLICDLKGLHKEELKHLVHSLDIWHKSCKLTAKLTKASKIKGNEAIKEWIEPIRNHFWHCAEISHGDEEALKNAWIGVAHHICGEHEWADGSCAHGPLTDLEKGKKYLLKDSKPFKAVQDIIFLQRWLKSLKYYVFFRHTSNLESFNSMMLQYAPKRNAFSNEAFSARVELAALDHNFHLFRQTLPGRGKKTYSKRSKNWKVQLVKEPKSYKYWLALCSKIMKRRVDDMETVVRHIDVPANHPINLAPNIGMRAAPPTKELLEAKLSRFQSKE